MLRVFACFIALTACVSHGVTWFLNHMHVRACHVSQRGKAGSTSGRGVTDTGKRSTVCHSARDHVFASTRLRLGPSSPSSRDSAMPTESVAEGCQWQFCSGRSTIDGPAQEQLLKCSGCRRVKYCGRDCQRLDWSMGGHKVICRQLSQKDSVPDPKLFMQVHQEWVRRVCGSAEMALLAAIVIPSPSDTDLARVGVVLDVQWCPDAADGKLMRLQGEIKEMNMETVAAEVQDTDNENFRVAAAKKRQIGENNANFVGASCTFKFHFEGPGLSAETEQDKVVELNMVLAVPKMSWTGRPIGGIGRGEEIAALVKSINDKYGKDLHTPQSD